MKMKYGRRQGCEAELPGMGRRCGDRGGFGLATEEPRKPIHRYYMDSFYSQTLKTGFDKCDGEHYVFIKQIYLFIYFVSSNSEAFFGVFEYQMELIIIIYNKKRSP